MLSFLKGPTAVGPINVLLCRRYKRHYGHNQLHSPQENAVRCLYHNRPYGNRLSTIPVSIFYPPTLILDFYTHDVLITAGLKANDILGVHQT